MATLLKTLTLSLFLASSAIAKSPPPPVNPADYAVITKAFQEVLASCFPDLKEKAVSLVPYSGGNDYFATNVKKMSVIMEPRHYVVFFNPMMFEGMMSQSALKGILVHELNHIRDYTQMTGLELLILALEYMNEDFHQDYERQTDLKAMEMGAASGLKEYREWLYPRLSGAVLEERKRYYWTPEEITEWQASHQPESCL